MYKESRGSKKTNVFNLILPFLINGTPPETPTQNLEKKRLSGLRF
jgi:hypothetical protein